LVLDYSIKIDLNSLVLQRNDIFEKKQLKKLRLFHHILICSTISIFLTYLDAINFDFLSLYIDKFENKFDFLSFYKYSYSFKDKKHSMSLNVSTFTISSSLENMIKSFNSVRRLNFFIHLYTL
jgi:hypothetical protein